MKDLPDYLTDTLTTGLIAGVVTTAAAMLEGQHEEGQPLGPINAVSHILWGDEAARHSEASAAYTLNGAALNLAAVTSWAAVQELCFSRSADRGAAGEALVGGAMVAGLAYLVDYHVVPRRLTPGFEMRLPGRSLFRIYTALALGLGLGSIASRALSGTNRA